MSLAGPHFRGRTCPGCMGDVWQNRYLKDDYLGEILSVSCIYCGFNESVYTTEQKRILQDMEAHPEKYPVIRREPDVRRVLREHDYYYVSGFNGICSVHGEAWSEYEYAKEDLENLKRTLKPERSPCLKMGFEPARYSLRHIIGPGKWDVLEEGEIPWTEEDMEEWEKARQAEKARSEKVSRFYKELREKRMRYNA